MISLKYMMVKTLLQIKLANMVVIQSQMILCLLVINYTYISNQMVPLITKVLLHLSVQVSNMTSSNIFNKGIKMHTLFLFQYLMTKIKLTTLSVRMILILVSKYCIFLLLWIAQINGKIVYVKIEMNVLMVQLHVEFILIVKILMAVSHVFVILGILIHQVIL